jgi:hypothetical protein
MDFPFDGSFHDEDVSGDTAEMLKRLFQFIQSLFDRMALAPYLLYHASNPV